MTSLQEETHKKGLSLFCMYAQEDRVFYTELNRHLSTLKRQKVITAWYDFAITSMDDWKPKVKAQFNNADIILLLISADFISSDYCYSTDMIQVIKRHEKGETHVIPIIMRPVDWLNTPIGKLQALPTSDKPVTTWTDIDEAFSDITQNIRQIVLSLLNQVEQKTKEQWIIEGKDHYDIHQYDDALTAYVKALALDPDNEPVRETVGRIQIQLGLYDKALTTYEELLRTSSSASGYLFKGLALQRMGKPIEALAAYQKAREHGYSG